METKNPASPHFISLCLWRPYWLSIFKQKLFLNSVQLRLVFKSVLSAAHTDYVRPLGPTSR